MLIKNNLIELNDYLKIEEIDKYNEYLLDLKQEVILLYHLHYKEDEIRVFLLNLNIEKDIIEIIISYFIDISKRSEKVYVNERDKNKLVHLWYKQYRDFRLKKSEGITHYPSMIIFQFQIEEIDKLINRFLPFMNIDVKNKIDIALERLLNDQFVCYHQFYLDFIKLFGIKNIKSIPNQHSYGDFLNQNKIVSFLSHLRDIILGGEYDVRLKSYYPFFMRDKEIQSSLKKYLAFRLNMVIKEYFKNLLKENVDSILSDIPKEWVNVRRMLNIPPLNFMLFKYIQWDFMPRDTFYDGVAVKDQRGEGDGSYSIYSLNFHPLSTYFSFFNREVFQIFLDQLIHHEFIHIMQYRYAEIVESFLKNTTFKLDSPEKYMELSILSKILWIDEEVPPMLEKVYGDDLWNYLQKEGGHTVKFKEWVNKFNNCKKAMEVRGKIETLYIAFYYKLWGGVYKGKWILCNPNNKL